MLLSVKYGFDVFVPTLPCVIVYIHICICVSLSMTLLMCVSLPYLYAECFSRNAWNFMYIHVCILCLKTRSTKVQTLGVPVRFMTEVLRKWNSTVQV